MMLNNVLTSREISMHWQVTPAAITKAVQNNRLTAFKSGNIYLFHYSSVLKLWGLPKAKLDKHVVDESQIDLLEKLEKLKNQ